MAAMLVHVPEVATGAIVVETVIAVEIVEAEAATEPIGLRVENEVMIEDLAQSEMIAMTKEAQIVAQGVLPVVMMVATDVQVRLVDANSLAVTSERN